MEQHEHPGQPGLPEPTRQEFAALASRVADLERQISRLQQQPSAPPEPASTPAPAPPPPPPVPVPVLAAHQPAAAVRPRASLENRLGSQVFNRVGIVALLIGATWFLKLAMDNHWIGPLGRILIGLLAGAALVVWSERFRRRGFPAFSYSLKAIGSGVLYLSLWAAFQLYHLLPASLALLAMILVTGWIAVMAWMQEAEMLAAYALVGGLSTPVLLSSGGDHEVFLFTYLLAIDMATVALVHLKGWPRLLLAAFPATAGYFIGWYAQHYTGAALEITTAYVAAFWAVFLLPSIFPVSPAGGPALVASSAADASRFGRLVRLIPRVFLPLANAAFVSLAMYSVLQDANRRGLLPWVMVLLSALYLALMRLPQASVTHAVHLSVAVVFLTIAIPLKASGHWITVAWLVEGVVLLWVSTRIFTSNTVEQTGDDAVAFRTLRLLACGALLLGCAGVFWQTFTLFPTSEPAFWNHRFATSLVGVAAFALAATIAHRIGTSAEPSAPTYRQIAAASVIALNLIAVFAGVLEIGRIFGPAAADVDAGLRSALATSAYLMVYGGVLLAIGFWKRSAFVRWQALLLLLFTIGKTFLYDMRNLSQGYRVVSFLGLGALLMAVSFAYQKDWLSLRDPAAGQPRETAE